MSANVYWPTRSLVQTENNDIYISIWQKMFILAVTNSFFENWNLYQRFHDMQLTLSLQFFSKKNFCIPACVSSSLAQIVFIFCWKKVFFGHTWLKLFPLCIILDIEVIKAVNCLFNSKIFSLSANGVSNCKMSLSSLKAYACILYMYIQNKENSLLLCGNMSSHWNNWQWPVKKRRSKTF